MAFVARLRTTMTADGRAWRRQFPAPVRGGHLRGMLTNVARLRAVVWALTRLSPA
jgi:hypothetical protein